MHLEVPGFCACAIFYFGIEIMFLVRNILSGVSCVIAIVQKNEGTPKKSEKSLSKYTAELSTGVPVQVFFFFFFYFSRPVSLVW